jgi:hypothetical protein
MDARDYHSPTTKQLNNSKAGGLHHFSAKEGTLRIKKIKRSVFFIASLTLSLYDKKKKKE